VCLTRQDEIYFDLTCHKLHRMTKWRRTGWWDCSPFSIPPLDLMTITMIGAEVLCEWVHLLQLIMSNTMPFHVGVPISSVTCGWITYTHLEKSNNILPVLRSSLLFRYCSTETALAGLGQVSQLWVTSSWSPKLFPWQWGTCAVAG